MIHLSGNWRAGLLAMQVGDKVSCPFEKYESVKSACSLLKLKKQGVWKTEVNKTDDTLIVTRIA